MASVHYVFAPGTENSFSLRLSVFEGFFTYQCTSGKFQKIWLRETLGEDR